MTVFALNSVIMNNSQPDFQEYSFQACCLGSVEIVFCAGVITPDVLGNLPGKGKERNFIFYKSVRSF